MHLGISAYWHVCMSAWLTAWLHARMLAGEGALLWAKKHAPDAVARRPQDLVTAAAEAQWRKYMQLVGALEKLQVRKEGAGEGEEKLEELRMEQGAFTNHKKQSGGKGTWGGGSEGEGRGHGERKKMKREGDEETVGEENIEARSGEVGQTGGQEGEERARVIGEEGEEEGGEEGEEEGKEEEEEGGEGEEEEEEEGQEDPWDTVGAVCFEVSSGAAAAASSGGIAFKVSAVAGVRTWLANPIDPIHLTIP
ncbi:unnamed protein product [Closterium sp. Naga37s-1]|nr:unnamed protein product [Closterium sp. Naga37s-1]